MQLTGITPILNVSDVPASLAWFAGLGWKRCWTYNAGGMLAEVADADEHGPANFAAVAAGDCEIFLCRDNQGSRGGPVQAAVAQKCHNGERAATALQPRRTSWANFRGRNFVRWPRLARSGVLASC